MTIDQCAQFPTEALRKVYGGEACQPGSHTALGDLPFTGFEVSMFLALAMALIVAGFILRRSAT